MEKNNLKKCFVFLFILLIYSSTVTSVSWESEDNFDSNEGTNEDWISWEDEDWYIDSCTDKSDYYARCWDFDDDGEYNFCDRDSSASSSYCFNASIYFEGDGFEPISDHWDTTGCNFNDESPSPCDTGCVRTMDTSDSSDRWEHLRVRFFRCNTTTGYSTGSTGSDSDVYAIVDKHQYDCDGDGSDDFDYEGESAGFPTWIDIDSNIDCDSDKICAIWAEEESSVMGASLSHPCRLKDDELCSSNSECYSYDCDSESDDYYFACTYSGYPVRNYDEHQVLYDSACSNAQINSDGIDTSWVCAMDEFCDYSEDGQYSKSRPPPYPCTECGWDYESFSFSGDDGDMNNDGRAWAGTSIGYAYRSNVNYHSQVSEGCILIDNDYNGTPSNDICYAIGRSPNNDTMIDACNDFAQFNYGYGCTNISHSGINYIINGSITPLGTDYSTKILRAISVNPLCNDVTSSAKYLNLTWVSPDNISDYITYTSHLSDSIGYPNQFYFYNDTVYLRFYYDVYEFYTGCEATPFCYVSYKVGATTYVDVGSGSCINAGEYRCSIFRSDLSVPTDELQGMDFQYGAYLFGDTDLDVYLMDGNFSYLHFLSNVSIRPQPSILIDSCSIGVNCDYWIHSLISTAGTFNRPEAIYHNMVFDSEIKNITIDFESDGTIDETLNGNSQCDTFPYGTYSYSFSDTFVFSEFKWYNITVCMNVYQHKTDEGDIIPVCIHYQYHPSSLFGNINLQEANDCLTTKYENASFQNEFCINSGISAFYSTTESKCLDGWAYEYYTNFPNVNYHTSYMGHNYTGDVYTESTDEFVLNRIGYNTQATPPNYDDSSKTDYCENYKTPHYNEQPNDNHRIEGRLCYDLYNTNNNPHTNCTGGRDWSDFANYVNYPKCSSYSDCSSTQILDGLTFYNCRQCIPDFITNSAYSKFCVYPSGSQIDYSLEYDCLLRDLDNDMHTDCIDNCCGKDEGSGLDGDGDGWVDLCDNCPLNYNPLQEDDDDDLVGEICDNCNISHYLHYYQDYPIVYPLVYPFLKYFHGLYGNGYYNPNQSDIDNDSIGDVCDICLLSPIHYDFDGDGWLDCLGNCSDGIMNRDESIIADYNGVCGSCYDEHLSPLIGETEIDYGGAMCGFCLPIPDKAHDQIWEIAHHSLLSKEDIPFDNDKYCEQGEGIFSIMVSIGVISVFVVIGVVIFIFSGTITGIVIFIMGRHKKRKKSENNRKIYKQ